VSSGEIFEVEVGRDEDVLDEVLRVEVLMVLDDVLEDVLWVDDLDVFVVIDDVRNVVEAVVLTGKEEVVLDTSTLDDEELLSLEVLLDSLDEVSEAVKELELELEDAKRIRPHPS